MEKLSILAVIMAVPAVSIIAFSEVTGKHKWIAWILVKLPSLISLIALIIMAMSYMGFLKLA